MSSKSIKLGECATGDIVKADNGETYVVFNQFGNFVWVRNTEPEEPWKEASEPRFLDPNLEVTMVRKGKERYPKYGNQAEVDPLNR